VNTEEEIIRIHMRDCVHVCSDFFTHAHTRAHRLSALSPPPQSPTSYKLILVEIQKKRPFGMGKYKTLTFAA